MTQPEVARIIRSIFRPVFAGSSYTKYQQKFLSLQTVKLPHNALTKDLEQLCAQKGGFLTMAELFQEELYGKHGYYATQSRTVLTDTPKRWGESLLYLCKQFALSRVVEIGPGDGALALHLLTAAQKENYPLSWSGVEIAEPLVKKIQENMKKYGFPYDQLVATTETLHMSEQILLLYVYALDSVPPEVVVHNHLLGVTIQKGKLQEILLSDAQLATRGMKFTKGILQTSTQSIDLTSWKLAPMQRAYIPVGALDMLATAILRAPEGSRICIIDEFRIDKGAYASPHLLVPRNPIVYRRDQVDIAGNYKKMGKVDYYFPQYRSSLEQYFSSLGIHCTLVDSETAVGEYLKKNHRLPKKPLTTNKKTLFLLTEPLATVKKRKKTVYPLASEDMRTRVSWEW